MATIWYMELLGGLRAVPRGIAAERGWGIVDRFETRRAKALLGYLAYFPQRAHRREALIELLWPECEPTAGRQRLRRVLYLLRCQLELSTTVPGLSAARDPGNEEMAVLVADREHVQLNLDVVATDVCAFEEAGRAAARSRCPEQRAAFLETAIERYQGELLPGLYEEWVFLERMRLAEAYYQALLDLGAYLEQQGDLPLALNCAWRAASADPHRAEGEERLIRLLRATGATGAAARRQQHLLRLPMGRPECRRAVGGGVL